MSLIEPPTEHFFAEDALNDSDALGLVSHLNQIAYCSVAVPHVMSLHISDWIAQANGPASQPSITGILMWEGHLMVHWLEGSQAQLDALWMRIESDVGQHCLVPLFRRRGIAQRLFSDWQMLSISRNDMIAIVREAKEQAHSSTSVHDAPGQHAISTLSILLDPDLTDCYAQAAKPNTATDSQRAAPASGQDFSGKTEVRSA